MSRRQAPSEPPLRRAAAAALATAIAVALGWAVLSLPPESAGLVQEAFAELERSGAANPVTAVLLNYRAYDTLLEVAVLLLAAIATWSMARADEPDRGIARGAVLRGLARLLAPLLIFVAGYFLWLGSARPGGAFQAGAVLGGAGVLVLLAYGRRRVLPPPALARLALASGLAVFLAAGAAAMAAGGRFLEGRGELAAVAILVVETAAVVSIGVTLAALYLGGRPPAGGAAAASHAGERGG